MDSAGRLKLLNMRLVEGAGGRLRTQGASLRSSVSQLASLWRQRSSRGRSNYRSPGRLIGRIGVICGDPGVPEGCGMSHLERTGTIPLPRAYYTAGLDGVPGDEAVSSTVTVALVTTALAATLLIGTVGLIMMSGDISANIWPYKAHGFVQDNELEPATLWSPPSEVQVHTRVLARRKKASTQGGVVSASKATTLGSSTPRSDPHHHGPRYADEDAVSEPAGKEAEPPAATPPGAPETAEEPAVATDDEQPTSRVCSVALHTYCVKVRDEYYYQPAMNACVMTATDSTVVCNHSRNRFKLHASCRKRCVESAVPAEECFQAATFSKCT
ncbi:hypothetical protein MTO96_038903, partial [Rhipicephalus appendiculatus]